MVLGFEEEENYWVCCVGRGKEMSILSCCRIKTSDAMKKNSLKNSKSSVYHSKGAKNHDGADAFSTVPRSASLNTG